MASIWEKLEIIRAHEATFADMLSAQVIESPKLSIWMILIPITFLSYFQQVRRYAAGRKEFSKQYLLNKQQAIDAAFQSINSGTEPDTGHLAGLSDVPGNIKTLQAEVQNVLVGHFLSLLRASGDDYDALIRSTYRDRTNYLLFLNRLNKVENEEYTALAAKLTEEGASNAVEAVKRESERLRRQEAERIFP